MRSALLAKPARASRSAADGLDDARTLHLDRDLAAVAQRRAMHLRQRGAAERPFLEVGEGLADAHAEFVSITVRICANGTGATWSCIRCSAAR